MTVAAAPHTAWEQAKQVIGEARVTLGPQASQQYLNAPGHLAMVLARYRTAAALIGNAKKVVELGAGEGIGAGILAEGREWYLGIDPDAAAIEVARETHAGQPLRFFAGDTGSVDGIDYRFDAAVALDVIEHIPGDQEDAFLQGALRALTEHGVLVLGTPSVYMHHLASPQSKVGHCNLHTPESLRALLAERFHVVQSFGMQATEISLGHPSARHYLIMAGIGPR